MKKNTSVLQKIAFYSGIVSFISSVICLIFLYFKIDDLGWQNPISASLMASSFFFASAGLVLVTIGKCNLPSFKVGKADS